MSRPAWLLLAVALLAAGCGPDERTGGDRCAERKLTQDSWRSLEAERIAIIIAFCERQYGAPAEAGRERFRPDYVEEGSTDGGQQ